MHIKRTIKNPELQSEASEVLPLSYLEPGEAHTGFLKGTLKKATFELHSGDIVIYELEE